MKIRLIYSFLVLASVFLISASFFKSDKELLVQTDAELGKKLFFDPILSEDKKISCASCHRPEFAFADNISLSKGVNGKLTLRNTPTVMNVMMRESFFWDGRTTSLEEQAIQPIIHPDEMNLPLEVAISRLNENDFYRKSFNKIYGKKADKETLAKAISAYEKTLETSDSRFDRYMKNKDSLSESEHRGLEVFNEKGNCFDCHFSPDFTGDEFINIGIFNEKNLNDSGRNYVTKETKDIGAFKVPGLRNIAITAPYMHNGMFTTLEEVVEYYNDPDKIISDHKNRDPRIKKLHLTAQEKTDLIAFLKTLTDRRFE